MSYGSKAKSRDSPHSEDGNCSARNGGKQPSSACRVSPSCAREETRESRGMPCLFLNTERGFGENHPKNWGFVGILRGQKCLKRRFSRRSPIGEWSRGARSMPRVFGRGSRSQLQWPECNWGLAVTRGL